MKNWPTIFVTGVTGNQGGAVARNLIAKGFSVKGLTRNPESDRAKKLRSFGVQLVQGDLDNPETYREHLQGVGGVFSVQTFENGVDREIAEGIAIADLSREMKVPHFIYSSTAGCDLNTGIPHWESKFKIENHVRQLGLPYTILRPTSLFENFLIPQVRTRLLKGKLASPIDKQIKQQLIASEDVGRVATKVFLSPELYNGRTLTIASETLDLTEIAAIFSQAIGKPLKVGKLPPFLTRLFLGKNLYSMFQWINQFGEAFAKMTLDEDVMTEKLSLADWGAKHLKPV